MSHIPAKTMQKLVEYMLEPEAVRPVMDHLFSGCPRCLSRLEVAADRLDELHPPYELVPGPRKKPAPGTHWRAVARALRQVPRWEQEELRRDKLLVLGQAEDGLRRILKLDYSPVATVEALLDLAFAERYRNPLLMEILAERAAHFARVGIDPIVLGVTETANLRAKTDAELANAYRVNLKFSGADKAFATAWQAWCEGSRDTLLMARILDLQASLATSRRDLPRAIGLLTYVQSLYDDLGDTHLVGRTLISLAMNTFYADRPEEAVVLDRQGLSLLDRGRDSQLYRLAQHNLLDHLASSGQYHEAAKLLLQSGLRQALAGEELPLAHLGWIEGKILTGRGKHRQAVRELEKAKKTFEVQNLRPDVALVSLELARVWLELREWGAVKTLTRAARTTFDELDVPFEAAKAVLLLEQACQAETATTGSFRRVLRFIRLLEWNPDLKYA